MGHSAQLQYAGCLILFIVMLNVITLSVIMLSVAGPIYHTQHKDTQHNDIYQYNQCNSTISIMTPNCVMMNCYLSCECRKEALNDRRYYSCYAECRVAYLI